ncbi:hypothetical protein DY000_02041336 [Brassica cretica]|uniref:Sulfotransferase n=2 Tax=Brassica cretica TaxID=69181 RepID=A0ABQ7B7J6_BRACR|nr:hypothetical protein DY000_02041336 [Brassica cretica]
MEKYELVKDIGSGNFGVARLMRVKDSKELVAMKYIERGPKQICHRDLKLENTLLDGSPAPRLKICDFGYSKSSLLHSRPKSTVGTPAYIAPEVLSRREYDGKMADVWSCGVTLYVMLVGAYPFEDPEDPKNFRKTMQRILAVQYKIPDYVHISQDCKHILSHIFVANPLKRITIAEIKKHPWFLKNLPRELTEIAQAAYYRKENPTFSLQSVEEIMKIVEEAKTPPPVSRSIGAFGWGGEEDAEEVSEEVVEEDEEDEYDKTVKQVHASGEIRISFSCGFCIWKSCKICSRRDRLQQKKQQTRLIQYGGHWILPKVRHHLAQSSSFLYSHSSNPLLKSNPHDLVPFIEGELSLVPQVDDVANDNGNTLFSTHIPYGLLPEAISKSGCKMVYIWRDPKDTFVSMWNFFQKERSDNGPLNTLEESFDMFCRGLSLYGPYLDHVMSYWNAYQENPDQILFLKYETIRADTLPYVKRLAEFMGYGFTAEEEKKGVVEEVVNLCSFETLKNLEANKGEKDREGTEGREDIPSNFYPKSAYFRKGKVGDWSNYLTPEMAARIDGLMEERFKGTGLLEHDI